MFYTSGLTFHFARNPNYRNSYTYASTHNIEAKMGKCPLKKKNLAFCPLFQTNYGNALVLKLDFLKIEL